METNNAKTVEQVVVVDAEQVEPEKKAQPFLKMSDGPFEIAIWRNSTKNGRVSLRMDLSVYSTDEDGNGSKPKVSFWLRDAYALADHMTTLARQATLKSLVKQS